MKVEIIFTEHYALIVSDKEIKVRDWFFNGEHILQASRITDIIIDTEGQWSEIKTSKKVIAHRPLEDAPILERVPLLPEFDESNKVEKLAYKWFVTADKKNTIFDLGWVNIFTAGYNKAKETYKYTEEDIQKAFIAGEERIINKPNSSELDDFTNFIQSLQQPKRPKYFKCETITMNKGYTDKSDYPYQECEILKTIINSQGQTELIGTYYYE